MKIKHFYGEKLEQARAEAAERFRALLPAVQAAFPAPDTMQALKGRLVVDDPNPPRLRASVNATLREESQKFRVVIGYAGGWRVVQRFRAFDLDKLTAERLVAVLREARGLADASLDAQARAARDAEAHTEARAAAERALGFRLSRWNPVAEVTGEGSICYSPEHPFIDLDATWAEDGSLRYEVKLHARDLIEAEVLALKAVLDGVKARREREAVQAEAEEEKSGDG